VLSRTAEDTGSILLDFWTDPVCLEQRAWAEDRVHLSSHGHRMLSYRAATALGIPGATELGALDSAVHEEAAGSVSWIPTSRWLWEHVRPWAWRRVRGRTAGDGVSPKHAALVPVPRV
jgi:phosphatidylinositol alpha 1,6-mannosyltransferase